MNISNTYSKVLKKVGDLEISLLIDVDVYCNKDQYEKTVTPIGYELTGGKYGKHTLSLDSNQSRLTAHWKGYLEANGVNTNELKVGQVYFS